MTPIGARRLAVGALAPALGAAAHVEAGGGLPELTLPVVLVAFLTAGLAASVVRRRVPVVGLVAVLGAGQVGWHLAMGVGAGHGEHAGHGAAHAVPSPGMVAAHAVVTLLVALGAAGADRAVRTLLGRRVGAVLTLLGPGPSASTGPGPRVVVRPSADPVAAVLLRTRPLRGPPVRPAVA